ncbi:MAG TPA: hypothetical protein VKD00_04660, partial [Methyloceanibacter sp.]|nr:hypothetical protein [Methyloceanibacter sp.]
MIERELGHPRTPLTFPVSSVLHENDGGGMKGKAALCRGGEGSEDGDFRCFQLANSSRKPEAQIPPCSPPCSQCSDFVLG